MSKKILAALLAVMMVLSLVPMTALAAEEPAASEPKIAAWGFVHDADTAKAVNKAIAEAVNGTPKASSDWVQDTMYIVLDKGLAYNSEDRKSVV